MHYFTRLSTFFCVLLLCVVPCFASPLGEGDLLLPPDVVEPSTSLSTSSDASEAHSYTSDSNSSPAASLPSPVDPPILGGYYIVGRSSSYGDCTLYFPVGTGWCLRSDGYLTRFEPGTVYGICVTSSGQRMDVRAYPYDLIRISDGSRYVDFRFVPSGGNVVVHDSFEPIVPVDTIVSYFGVFLLAFLVLLLLTRKR